MASCSQCGALIPGPQSPGVLCSGCLKPPTWTKGGPPPYLAPSPYLAPFPPAAPPSPTSQTIVSTSEHLDSHTLVTFTILAGQVPAHSEWKHTERVPSGVTLVVREITAVTSGGSGDVDLVLNSSVVRLIDADNNKMLFERPLGILTVMDARNRNAETEERLGRLERMMNILVEQESPAGEALRRLGGAKISYESPTKLARPELFHSGSTLGIRLTIHDTFTLLNDVVVRVSVIGVSKRPVT